MAAFDRVVLRGSPYERGREHGERFADAVASNVDLYRRRFAHDGLDLAAVDDQVETYLDTIADSNPSYAEEMRGVADGSGVALRDVAMLNVRWEVIYTGWKDEVSEPADEPTADGSDASADGSGPAADGCTSAGITPPATADGATYLAQNWDWLVGLEDGLFLMELRREDAPDVLAMTEAGIVGGKIGVNEHGIGLVVNGLVSATDGDEPFRKPYHVRFREALSADRFDDALRPIVETERTASANVVLGHADGEVVGLEAAPETVATQYPEDGILTHANHFETAAVGSLGEKRSPSTLYRARRLRRSLAADRGAIGPAGIQAALRDHFARPASVCSHPDDALPELERGQTNASFVLDLEGRRLFGVRGPPCEGEYREYAL